MTATLPPAIRFQPLVAGAPLPGGKVYFYAAGTLTPQAAYAADGTTPLANPLTLDANGATDFRLGTGLSYKINVTDSVGGAVTGWPVDQITGLDGPVTAFAANLASTSSPSLGSALVGMKGPLTGEVTLTQRDWDLMGDVDASRFGIVADAVWSGTAWTGTNNTASLQNAINTAFAAGKDLYIPAGYYLVTGLYLPGRTTGVDDRNRSFRIYGHGFGEPFSDAQGQSRATGTSIVSQTDAPVLQDYADLAATSNGTVEIDHLRFDGKSTTPVVLLQHFYGVSSLHHFSIFQRGVGDGLKITYSATASVHMGYSMNKDALTVPLFSARVGIAFNFPVSYSAGLLTFTKCTGRGFLTAFSIGGGAGSAYSPTIKDCECSTVYNGIIINAGTAKAVIDSNYLEGGESGTGILDNGDFTTISNNKILSDTSYGFAIGIDASSTTTKGTNIHGNDIGTSSIAGSKHILVGSSAAFGGYSKNVENNSLSYALGTNGVQGITISGTSPRLNLKGNMFDPRGAWTGTSSTKILNNAVSGAFGIGTALDGAFEFPVLSQGEVILYTGALADSAMTAANTMTVPSGSYFQVTMSVAKMANSLVTGDISTRFVTLRSTNANFSIQNSGTVLLAGGTTWAPGTARGGSITFMVERVGATNYAYEVARSVYV